MQQANKQLDFNAIVASLGGLSKEELNKLFVKGGKALIKQPELLRKYCPTAYFEVQWAFEEKGLTNPPKQRLQQLAALPFCHKEVFKQYISTLDPQVALILKDIILHGSTLLGLVKEEFGIDALEEAPKDSSIYYWRQKYRLKAIFEVLPCRNSSFYGQSYSDLFYLPEEFRRAVMPCMADEYNLEVAKLEKLPTAVGLKVFSGEEVILRELPGLMINLKEKELSYNKNGRISLTSIKSVRKKMQLAEFFDKTPINEQTMMRTNMVLSAIGLLDFKEASTDTAKAIKTLFLKKATKLYPAALHLLFYLGNMNTLNNAVFLPLYSGVFDWLKSAEAQDNWVEFSSFEKSLQLTMASNPLDVMKSIGYGDLILTFDKKAPEHFNKHESIYIGNLKQRFIIGPTFRGVFFLLAAWGVLEIAYEEVDCSTYLSQVRSPYDGLRYFRLTPLGRYVLGLQQDYTANYKRPFVLQLDPDALSILLVEGDMDLAARAIASFAKPLSDKRLQTSADLFLANCNTAKDLRQKIDLFTSIFSGELPEKWKSFFDEIYRKSNPLKEVSGYTVFQLPADDRGLLQLIARDEELKQITVKAENFHLLVKKENLAKLRSLLRSHGYLVE